MFLFSVKKVYIVKHDNILKNRFRVYIHFKFKFFHTVTYYNQSELALLNFVVLMV